ncbi:MAG TPA: TetR/AcrR family transcriptional regulator [Acidimicrobiales bacterium]|jgi:AcrR family transcriptional regulator|nr:TetR/AcrR family transcriptional regulator [Acidimicrobiales bacterium]
MQAVLDAVAERLMAGDELLIRIPEICEATGVNYGSVYHHFGSREGVIDAAYNMIFSRLVEEDIRTFHQVNESVQTLDEYIRVMQPIVTKLSSGPDRKGRRAMRIRIVAAASTRPRLKELIGETQARLTADLARLTSVAQQKGWLRDDISPRALAVLFQILIFGRALDDVSAEPIEEETWELTSSVLFADLLKR